MTERLDPDRLARALQATNHSTEARTIDGFRLLWTELGHPVQTRMIQEAERIIAAYNAIDPVHPDWMGEHPDDRRCLACGHDRGIHAPTCSAIHPTCHCRAWVHP